MMINIYFETAIYMYWIREGAYSAPQDSPAGFKGPYCGREGRAENGQEREGSSLLPSIPGLATMCVCVCVCVVKTLNVVDGETQYSQQRYTVKALSCDTVTQLKHKILDTIYRYVPYSLRPDSTELDLGTQ